MIFLRSGVKYIIVCECVLTPWTDLCEILFTTVRSYNLVFVQTRIIIYVLFINFNSF